jgi:hypothetical protein
VICNLGQPQWPVVQLSKKIKIKISYKLGYRKFKKKKNWKKTYRKGLSQHNSW